MKTAARIAASILSSVLLIPWPHPAAAQSQQREKCCQIEGEVVEVVGNQYRPLKDVTVAIKRKDETINESNTSSDGHYRLTFENGDPINIYYITDKWEVGKVTVISGRRNHRITKVLKPMGQTGQMSPAEAGEYLSALEELSVNPGKYAETLNHHVEALRREHFPAEFWGRLYRIEQWAATRRKQNQPLPPITPPFLLGPTSPVSFTESAGASTRLLWFNLVTRRFESYFTTHLPEFRLPLEVPRPRRPQDLKLQPAPDTWVWLEQLTPRPFHQTQPSAPFVVRNLIGGGRIETVNLGVYRPLNDPTFNAGYRPWSNFRPGDVYLLGGDHSMDDSFHIVTSGTWQSGLMKNNALIYLGHASNHYNLQSPFDPADVAGIGSVVIATNAGFRPSQYGSIRGNFNPYMFDLPVMFGHADPVTPPDLRVIGANLFSVVPGNEYSLEITGPSIDKDSVLSVPAQAEGIAVRLNNPDPTARVLRVIVAVAENVEPREYKLLVNTGDGQKSLPFHVYPAPPEVSGEVGYPGASDAPPAADSQTPQEVQVIIRGKHLRGAKVEPVSEAAKWLRVEGEPAASPDGTTLTLKVTVREQTPAGLYTLRLSNRNPEQKTQNVEFRVVARP